MDKKVLKIWLEKEIKNNDSDGRYAIHNDMWWAGYTAGKLSVLEEVKKLYYR